MNDIKCGQTLTSVQQVAKLWFNSQHWLFEYERAYSWKELNLMVQLAANMPVFRGGKSND